MPKPSSLLRFAALACLAVLVVACSGGKKSSSSGSAVSTEQDPRPFDTPAPGTPTATGQITGLFSQPRDTTKVTKTTLGPKPVSSLQPSDRKSVVLYDTKANTQTDFGAGVVTTPALNTERLLYTSADNQAWMVNLATGEKTQLGPANLAFFLDEGHVYLVSYQQPRIVVDLATGQRQITNSVSQTVIGEQETTALGGPLFRHAIKGGLIVGYSVDVPQIYALECRKTPTPESELCGLRFKEEFTINDEQGNVLYQFRAMAASPAGPNEIVVATSPLCDDGAGKQVWCEEVLSKLDAANSRTNQYAKGTTNIFIVNLKTGKAKFVATAAYDPPTQVKPYNWPLSADANYVVWTENYCGQTKGKTRIYNRQSGEIKELDSSLWVRMDGGLIGVGEFGARAFVNPVTLQYTKVLPDNLPDVTWSDDYRYAAVGTASPHGGLCGG